MQPSIPVICYLNGMIYDGIPVPVNDPSRSQNISLRWFYQNIFFAKFELNT